MTTRIAPAPSDWDDAVREEITYRKVMRYVTDRLWALRAHELGMALLHDLLDDAEARQAVDQPLRQS